MTSNQSDCRISPNAATAWRMSGSEFVRKTVRKKIWSQKNIFMIGLYGALSAISHMIYHLQYAKVPTKTEITKGLFYTLNYL